VLGDRPKPPGLCLGVRFKWGPVHLAKAVGGLSLTGNATISFEIDPEVAMRVVFGTSLATYELYASVV
jgi:hypothetical protein